MQRYEFHVIPAPRRGEKARGVKTTEDRFALALTGLMNRMGAEGWDYIRADVLPVDERAGLTGGIKTSFQNMLVFRRPLPEAVAVPDAAHAAGQGGWPAPAAPVAAAPAIGVPALGPADTGAPRADLSALRLGAAAAPQGGAAPAVGPAKPDLAAE